MEFLHLLVIVLFWTNGCSEGADLDYDGKLNIRLDHALDATRNPSYFHRGDIFIKSLYSGACNAEETELTKEQIRMLKDLAKKNSNYRLRATAKNTDGKENYYYTFVKACSLVQSLLVNVITINLDHNGNVIAITMAVPNKCLGAEMSDNLPVNFNTTVEVRHMELGPAPDTATYIQKLEKEREAKERGEAKDNRSFLAKYWMYIVPVIIFMLLQSATGPETSGAAQSHLYLCSDSSIFWDLYGCRRPWLFASALRFWFYQFIA